MKSFYKIALGVIALSFAQQASAANIRITGSTAFRGGAHDAIVAMMGGTPASNVATCKIASSVAAPGTVTDATSRTAINGANIVTFVGDLSSIGISGTSTVQCSWSGSASGLIAVFSGDTTLTYVPSATAAGATAGYANTVFGASASDSGAALFAFSDVYQASVTSTPVSGLTNTNVAIVPFVYVANKGSNLCGGYGGTLNPSTGMTAQRARALSAAGVQPKSLFTGNAADTSLVIGTGRDGGSGTRITFLAETKFGIANLVKQYFATTSGSIGSGTVSELKLWPTTGNGADTLNPGNGGYTSGSSIRDLMGYTSSSGLSVVDSTGAAFLNPFTGAAITAADIIGYLGAGDAATATGATNQGVRLTYEGVSYDGTATDKEKLYNGAYTMWCYQHLNHKGALVSGTDDRKFNDGMKTNIVPNLGVNGLDIALMKVSRTNDGAVVGP